MDAGFAAIVALASLANGDVLLAERSLGARAPSTVSAVRMLRSSDGRVVSVAGQPNAKYQYDYSSGQWKQVASFPGDAPMQPIPVISGLLATGSFVYIATSDPLEHDRIYRLDLAQARLTLIAGGGGQSGDGVLATSAELLGPTGLATTAGGALLFAEFGSNRVRRIDSNGTISTVAGRTQPRPTVGFVDANKGLIQRTDSAAVGDGGAAVDATLVSPRDIAVDSAGNVYIAEAGGHRVRRIDVTGRITTVAGTGIAGSTGDGGPATNARLYAPQALALDSLGGLLIADTFNHRIRAVDPAGAISTICGTGRPGYSGDGGPATGAQLDTPGAMRLMADGRLLIAEEGNRTLREVRFL